MFPNKRFTLRFRYTSELQNAFSNGDISGLRDLESKGTHTALNIAYLQMLML